MPSAVGVRAWRILASEEQREKTAECEQQGECAAKAKAELQKICDGILALMDKELIPSASTEDSKVFCFKMKDDYNRCLAESATGDARSKSAEDDRVAHTEATKVVERDLIMTQPIRLDIALSISVFQSDPDEARKMARAAVDVVASPSVPQERIQERVQQHTVEETVMEEITGLVKLMPQERVQHRTVEQTVNLEDIAEKIQLVPQECIPACDIEQTVDISVPQSREPSVEIVKVIPTERLQQRTAEQIVDRCESHPTRAFATAHRRADRRPASCGATPDARGSKCREVPRRRRSEQGED